MVKFLAVLKASNWDLLIVNSLSLYSLGYTYGKFLGSYKGIKLGSNCGKLSVTVLGNVDLISLGIDVGTCLGSLYGSFDDSNDYNLEGLLLGDSLEYTDGKTGII